MAATKHVFVGETRLASKLLPPPGSGEGTAPIVLASATGGTGPNDNGCDPSNYQPQKCPYVPATDPLLAHHRDDTKVRHSMNPALNPKRVDRTPGGR